MLHMVQWIGRYLNAIALRMAKTLWSFGHSECNRVKASFDIPAQAHSTTPCYLSTLRSLLVLSIGRDQWTTAMIFTDKCLKLTRLL